MILMPIVAAGGLTGDLQDDHEALRGLTELLDVQWEQLNGEPGRWEAVRQTLLLLAGRLRQHMRREGDCAADCLRRLGRLGAREWNCLALDHEQDAAALEVLLRTAAAVGCHAPEELEPSLRWLLRGLRSRMAEQETWLHPLLDAAGAADPQLTML